MADSICYAAAVSVWQSEKTPQKATAGEAGAKRN